MSTRTGFVRQLLSLVFPSRCLICGTLDTDTCLCAKCVKEIPEVQQPACDRCGLSVFGPTCTHCSARTPAFKIARSAGAYDGVLRTAVHHMKYRDRPQLAEPLSACLLKCLQTNESLFNSLKFDSIVAVPMNRVRQRQRGYNQAARLATFVAADLQIPISVGTLQRTRRTRAQVGLASAARSANLVSAFAAPPDSFAGQVILLIDDVTTTGSTLHECAAALKAAGAKYVYALTLAGG